MYFDELMSKDADVYIREEKESWMASCIQMGNVIGSLLLAKLTARVSCLHNLLLLATSPSTCLLNSTSFPNPCCDTQARLPALPVHPTCLNYLQVSSSSYSDRLAAGGGGVTSSPTLSVQFCCSCYLYVNHQLMNNMTCIAVLGYCSLASQRSCWMS